MYTVEKLMMDYARLLQEKIDACHYRNEEELEELEDKINAAYNWNTLEPR